MAAHSSGDVQIKNSYLHRINQLKLSEGVRAMLTTLCSIEKSYIHSEERDSKDKTLPLDKPVSSL